MSPLEIFRIVAQEFASLSDEIVNQWIELSKPLISENKFGNTYNQSLAYLAAHKLKLAGYGDTSTGNIDDALRVSSYSEGGTSISYSTSQSGVSAVDAEYALTVYGLQFLTIRRTRVIPIISSAEATEV